MTLLAIDLGTTGVRAVLIAVDGRQLGVGEKEIPIISSSPGWAEQSPELFWDGTVTAVRQAVAASAINPKEIAAIGFAHQRGTFTLVDEWSRPLVNFVVWMDHRGVPYLDEIEERIGAEEYYALTGTPIYFVSAISKLVWFVKKQPEVYQAARWVWPISNLIMARMGVDEPPIDHATASFFGLLNTRTREWADQLSARMGLDRSKLANLVAPGTLVGELSNKEAAEELGLPLGIPLVIGGGDQQCAALGSGMIHPGHGLINLGTATAVMAAVDGPLRDPAHIIPSACHAVPDQWEMEGHTQASGIILQRFRDEFASAEVAVARRIRKDPYGLLAAQAELSTPGASGLIFLPTLNGTTAPINYPHATGVLLGLLVTHNRADVLRAMMEGMCFESRWILEHMQASGAQVSRLFFSGGGSKSDLWCQLHADILERDITRVSISNAAAVGAAIIAGMGIGLFRTASAGVDSMSRMSTTFVPNADLASLYSHVFGLFKQTYETLVEHQIFAGLEKSRRNLLGYHRPE